MNLRRHVAERSVKCNRDIQKVSVVSIILRNWENNPIKNCLFYSIMELLFSIWFQLPLRLRQCQSYLSRGSILLVENIWTHKWSRWVWDGFGRWVAQICAGGYLSYQDITGWRFLTWWRRQMETFSALLTRCAGNSPVPGEFPTQGLVTRSFDVFFDLRLNKRLSKQPWGWWFETPSWSLWRPCNELLSRVELAKTAVHIYDARWVYISFIDIFCWKYSICFT